VIDAARRRSAERHGAAIVRALSGEQSADLRGQRLRLNGHAVSLASPYLAADLATVDQAHARGVADNLGLLVRHCDLKLHRRLAPDAPVERVVFDLIEQIRCESLVPAEWPGTVANLDAAFVGWSQAAQGQRIAETGVGLLIFTIAHMVRGRLVRPISDPHVDETIEATRATLAPIIGESLYALPRVRDDQESFAFHSRTIAEAVALVAGDAALAPAAKAALDRTRLVLAGFDSDNVHQTGDGIAGRGFGEGGDVTNLADLGDYCVYTREFDREVGADHVVPQSRRTQLRAQLDQHRRAQAVGAARVAQRLVRQLAHPAADGWTFGEQDGLLDGARLSQLVTDPANHRVFRRERRQPHCDVCVTFLVDTTGSMKQQRFEAAAVLLDTFAQALDLAGASSEILGFTTRRWNGGRALKAWRAGGANSPAGRVTEVEHIVYKDAETSWKRSRRSIAAMLSTHHYREGVDGEALIWAYDRLCARPEARRLLVMISDGTPMESATATTNRDGFLDDHLHSVAAAIERRGDVELGALTLDGDVSSVFRRSLAIDLSGPQSIRSYGVLAELFG